RIVDFGQIDELFLLDIPELDASRLVLQLGGEGAEAAVVAERRVVVAAQVDRVDGAEDLARGNAVVFVEINLRMLWPVTVGGERDQEFQFGLLHTEGGHLAWK